MRTHVRRQGHERDSNGGHLPSPADSPTKSGLTQTPTRQNGHATMFLGGVPHQTISMPDEFSRSHSYITAEQWMDQTDIVLMTVAITVSLFLCIIVTRLRSFVHEATPLQVGPAMTLQHINDHVQANTTHTAIQYLRPQQGALKQPWGPLVRPLVIAHRGASADFPEHTREAYMKAIEEGADVIECDVVLTRDLKGLCRHEPNLVGNTDVLSKFPDRVRWEIIDKVNVTGVFASDLMLSEIKTLRAVQPWPFRDQSYNGKLSLVTLEEYLDLALSAPRTVGIYPETKHPVWHNLLPVVRAANTSIERVLLTALTARGYQGPIHSPAWLKQPAYIQSFETASLRTMAQQTCLPLIQLLGTNLNDTQPDGRSVRDMLDPQALQELAQLVVGVGPGKDLLVAWRDGAYVSSGVMQKFHAVGLQVHTYTLRDEPQFILSHVTPNTTRELEVLLVRLGVDGVFADEPNTTISFIKSWVTNHNCSRLNRKRPCLLQPASLRGDRKSLRAGAGGKAGIPV